MNMQSRVQLSFPFIPQRLDANLDTRVVMALYLLRSPVLRDFVQPLGIHAYVVGLAVERYLEQKVLDVGLRNYASIVAPKDDRQRTIRVHPDGGEWHLEPLPCPTNDKRAAALTEQLPVGEYRDGVITFRLAHELRIKDVEQQFHRVLAARNLNIFLASKTGRERLATTGVPGNARLFTDYEQMGEPCRSLASAIYLINPERELAVLLQALVLAVAASNNRSER